jgi:hypothetical protein
VLFDGLGGYADDFGEFPGRIVGMIFEQLEDFLPTYSSFLTTYLTSEARQFVTMISRQLERKDMLSG